MTVIMILAGLLSSMNLWTDKIDDIRLHLNDLYMISLMTAWMLLFMAIYYKDVPIAILGGVLVSMFVWCIRTQAFVTPKQFYLGMIPHHSMAVHMSKQLLQSYDSKNSFVLGIVETQEKEIEQMKKMLDTL